MRYFPYVHQVHFDETNLVGNVYFANYVRWQGHCREKFLYDNVPGVVADLQARTLALITVSVHVDHYYEAFAGDTVEVRMYPSASSGSRLSMRFDYMRNATKIASGSQTIACAAVSAETSTMQSCPVPASLLKAFHAYDV